MAKSEDVKPSVDWGLIEAEFRAGKSLRAIAEDRGVSHVAISKRAKRDGWTKDLQAQIKAKADAVVNKAAVNREVNSKQSLTEQQVVEANAQAQATIRLTHRGTIARNNRLMLSLLAELEGTTDNVELFEKLGELLDESGPDANGNWKKDRLNEIYQKVISMGGRVDNAKKLVEMLEKLVKLERQAYGIKEDGEESGAGIEDVLAGIGRKVAEQLGG